MNRRKNSFVAKGRVAVYAPNHPKANGSGYVLRSRFKMEKKIGRLLSSDEVVHHIDGNFLNDRISNLYLTDIHKHINLHRKDFNCMKLDYTLIEHYMRKGNGYKNIAKITGYNVASVKSATRAIRINLGVTKGFDLSKLIINRASQKQC